MFHSEIRDVGGIEFPEFTGLRIMMMPLRLDDVAGTVPAFASAWHDQVERLAELAPVRTGVAYLTIDEALVKAGETHRRPGIHVDGVGPDGKAGAWGGGGYAYNGMLTSATHVGCRGWTGEFQGRPAPNGDCSALTRECVGKPEVVMQPGRVYFCGPMAVHEALPMPTDTRRQFVRLSMPSRSPWYEGYTRNPTGVEPEGEVHPPRTEFMGYRP